MKKVFIYILVDPRKPELVRYVGQTDTPRARHIQHCCEGGRSTKCEWVESLRQDGFMPQMIIVQETVPESAYEIERIWIARFVSSGLLSNTQSLAAHIEATPDAALPALKAAEKDAIITMLKECKGNKLKTSKRLGMGRQTLYNKIHAYGIK